MEEFRAGKNLKQSLARFERAAAKGHEESIWILSVVKDVEMERFAWKEALKEAFAKTEKPLGYYFAGQFSDPWDKKDPSWKKSAEGGCSWGQVRYGLSFREGDVLDDKMYVEWLEKAANQNNPEAMDWLGYWFRGEGDDEEKTVSYYWGASELGWKNSIFELAMMLSDGEGCAKDLKKAAICSAKGNSTVFWKLMRDARQAFETDTAKDLDCDFNQFCFVLGRGLYWYIYGEGSWRIQYNHDKAFGNQCLDFYCATMELQQKSIFTFLLFWNRTVGVKDPGVMIGKLVWEERGMIW
jgi:hypothetical protein